MAEDTAMVQVGEIDDGAHLHKVSVVGVGQVGMAIAFSILTQVYIRVLL